MNSPALDEILDAATADEQIVGAVVLIAEDGDLVHAGAAGYADRESKAPMRLDHLFRYASLTKPIVALTTMSLVERGVLDLTSPLTRWLPAFRPALSDGSRPDITVDHLLTHTSGLTYGFGRHTDDYARLGVSDGMDRTDLTLADEVDRVGQVQLAFAPGRAWAYSVGYDVLGGLLEAVTGTPLPDLVHDLVTGPLGMAHAGFSLPATPDLTTAYMDATPPPMPVAGGHAGPDSGGRCNPHVSEADS